MLGTEFHQGSIIQRDTEGRERKTLNYQKVAELELLINC
jgi:hypothetical protein